MKWLSDQAASSSDASAARLAQSLRWKVRRTQAVLAVNRVWPTLWLPLAVAGCFLLISLFGAWPLLPADVHRVLLWGFGAAQIVAFAPVFRVQWPTTQEALRHMEKTAGLPHRPATSYHDQLSAGGAASAATNRLWTAHRERTARLFARLRAGWPNPRVDEYDPFALRVALVLLLGVGLIANRDDATSRIKAAFQVSPALLSGATRLDAWITPPVYTGKPPVLLADGSRADAAPLDSEKRFLAPAKSELTVRVNNTDASRYALRLKPMQGETKMVQPTFGAGKESFADFRETLTGSGDIELLESGETVARWAVDIIIDTPPKIALLEAPAEQQRGSLRFRYKVEDDYGVVSAQALFERDDTASISETDDEGGSRTAALFGRRLGKAPTVPLALPRANAKSGEGQTYRDLTPHFWAGLPVTVTLEARDQAGQTGRSAPQTMILPERQFGNPAARAIIEQRKLLVARPDRKAKVAEALDALTLAPEKFIPDMKLYLALRTAYWRIHNASTDETLESGADLLWQIALSIEEGDLSDAERQLRAAQDALMRALEENAPEQEIKRLMAELRTALDRYIESARKQAQNQEFDPRQEFGNQRAVTSKDLDRMLKQIEDLARTGSRDEARRMLSELRDLMENSQTKRQAGNNQNREAMNMLNGLSDVIAKQQKLLDETFRAQNEENPFGEDGETLPGEDENGMQSTPNMPGQEGQGQAQGQGQGQGRGQKGQKYAGLKDRQGEIQKQLRQLMDQLRGMGANPPEQMDGAGQAMNEAGKALGDDNAERATEQQTLALDKLRSGTKSLAEQMMKNGRGQQGRGTANSNRDPLGRPTPGRDELDNGDSVKVPERSELDLQRAREILDELRRRLGERSRPPSELDYIERLIERF